MKEVTHTMPRTVLIHVLELSRTEKPRIDRQHLLPMVRERGWTITGNVYHIPYCDKKKSPKHNSLVVGQLCDYVILSAELYTLKTECFI